MLRRPAVKCLLAVHDMDRFRAEGGLALDGMALKGK
jgi:hypothetical protein